MFGATTKSVTDLFSYQLMRNTKNHNTTKCCSPFVVFLIAALKNSPLPTNTYITTRSFPSSEICVCVCVCVCVYLLYCTEMYFIARRQ